jgi:hypothetical protein
MMGQPDEIHSQITGARASIVAGELDFQVFELTRAREARHVAGQSSFAWYASALTHKIEQFGTSQGEE